MTPGQIHFLPPVFSPLEFLRLESWTAELFDPGCKVGLCGWWQVLQASPAECSAETT
jgi:hypothetical protein